MKPSDRIYEIFRERKGWRGDRNDINDLEDEVEAIKQYLNEEHEKHQESYRILLEWEKERLNTP